MARGQPHGLSVCRTGQELLVPAESLLEEPLSGGARARGVPGSAGTHVVVSDQCRDVNSGTCSSSTFA